MVGVVGGNLENTFSGTHFSRPYRNVMGEARK